MELKCQVQNYEWGKIGSNSTVAQLAKNYTEIDDNVPYAELWMGTHVNGPSIVKCTGVHLKDYIKENTCLIGEKVVEVFGEDLPFLFKVLSVNKALSIQAHPDKQLAEDLHKKFPDIYKDDNHKPELAIALTPFEALCGFRPVSEIRNFVENIPELGKIIGDQIKNISNDDEFLRQAFIAVLSCQKDVLENELNIFICRIQTLDACTKDLIMAPLIENLNTQFPNDVGLFVVYFLNYVKLQPSEAMFLGASKPHAYLSGDCIECMACSDNVVRAGFTPKFIDVDTLTSMLIYKGETPRDILFSPEEEDDFTKLYKPPVPDFAVAQIKVPNNVNYSTIKRVSASILLVISGVGSTNTGGTLDKGTVLFIPVNETLTITAGDDLIMFQAFANV
ncbi:unnamed protein product [Brassicogethes aeneus]|uniref:mannose-6-phosphate isomerase n=1 Tax=Brassicogethes aeneus TaxID=1431903 RepID=A0A9P0BEJ9_BRAAE|nr:unnamed protein product [Brassicogethes aeneus]